MDEKLIDDEFGHWFSTYGLITSLRILGYYQLDIPQKELLQAIKNSTSFYHRLVQVPLKNVLNGIILQQANDYHIYAQKLFIDYLLSGESGKPPEAQGATTRESLEEERKALVNLGEQFNQKQLEHETVIGVTQKSLIKLTKDLKEYFESAADLIYNIVKQNGMNASKELIKNSMMHALIYCGVDDAGNSFNKSRFIDKMNEIIKINMTSEIKNKLEQLNGFFDTILSSNEKISELLENVLIITQVARSFRTQFYQAALHVIELLKLLSEYRIDPEQDIINRESLYFDKTIGEA